MKEIIYRHRDGSSVTIRERNRVADALRSGANAVLDGIYGILEPYMDESLEHEEHGGANSWLDVINDIFEPYTMEGIERQERERQQMQDLRRSGRW